MLDIWSSSKTLFKIHTYTRTFHISHWMFLPCTGGPVRVHGDNVWVGTRGFDMTKLVVQKKKLCLVSQVQRENSNKQPKNCPV